MFVERVACTSVYTYSRSIAPLFVDHNLWRFVEVLQDREFVFTDFHGTVVRMAL